MRKPFEWAIPTADDGMAKNDSLLSCLVMLTKYYKSPSSARTLTANLPLKEGKLNPALFSTAAERARLETQLIQCGLQKIKNATLPVVLLLADGSSCLLVEKNNEYARILLMETGSGLNSVKLEELEKMYGGYAIYVKPFYNFSQRSKDTLKKEDKNWLLRSISKAWPLYVEIIFGSALVNLFAIAMPLFVMNVYDRVVPNQAIETLWVLASGVAIVFLFDFLLKSMRSYFIDAAGKRIDVELSSKIFSKILGIQMGSRPRSVGALANTVQSFEVFRDFITSTTITILVDIPFVFLFIFIISLIGGDIYMLPLVMLPIVIIVGILLQWPLIKLTRQSYQYSAEKQATLIESLGGIETIKTCGAEGAQQQRWESVVTRSAKLGSKLRFISTLSVNFTLICQQLVSVSVVIYGVYKITAGDLTMGALIACTILSGRAIAPIAQLAGLFTRYFQSVNALKSINQVMQMPTDIVDQKSYLHRPNLDGSIEFKDVCFFYEKENLQILNNLSFKIGVGERVGIIGTIGTGKTTIAKLMMGLYPVAKGTILIGGVDQNQINPADLRNQIGYVPQDVVLFYGTIKENISFGASHMDDASILKASKIAGVDNFVKGHPDGYDMQVGERGKNISQGQRQAVAIARSLLLSPKLMVLDEPCASMDVNTETAICSYLKNNVPKSTTMIVITHKPSILRLVDRLMVLDGGKLVMDGPRDKVLEKLHGKTADKVHYKPNQNIDSKIPSSQVKNSDVSEKLSKSTRDDLIKQHVESSMKNANKKSTSLKNVSLQAEQIINKAKIEAEIIKAEQIKLVDIRNKELEAEQVVKMAQLKASEIKELHIRENKISNVEIKSSKIIKDAQEKASDIVEKAEIKATKFEETKIKAAEIRSEAIINRASNETAEKIKKYKRKGLDIISNAKLESEKINNILHQDAKAKASLIIKNAELEAATFKVQQIKDFEGKKSKILKDTELEINKFKELQLKHAQDKANDILQIAELKSAESIAEQENIAMSKSAQIIKLAEDEANDIKTKEMEISQISASGIISEAKKQNIKKIKEAEYEAALIIRDVKNATETSKAETIMLAKNKAIEIIENAKAKAKQIELTNIKSSEIINKEKINAQDFNNQKIEEAEKRACLIILEAEKVAQVSLDKELKQAENKAAQLMENAKKTTTRIVNKERAIIRDAEIKISELKKIEDSLIKEQEALLVLNNDKLNKKTFLTRTGKAKYIIKEKVKQQINKIKASTSLNNKKVSKSTKQAPSSPVAQQDIKKTRVKEHTSPKNIISSENIDLEKTTKVGVIQKQSIDENAKLKTKRENVIKSKTSRAKNKIKQKIQEKMSIVLNKKSNVSHNKAINAVNKRSKSKILKEKNENKEILKLKNIADQELADAIKLMELKAAEVKEAQKLAAKAQVQAELLSNDK